MLSEAVSTPQGTRGEVCLTVLIKRRPVIRRPSGWLPDYKILTRAEGSARSKKRIQLDVKKVYI